MKKIIFSLLCVAGFLSLSAQQENQYTQWMNAKLSINPAYAGSNFSPCLTGLYRNQWIGFDAKTPTTQQLSYDMSLANDRVGIGANLYRNSVGISEFVTFDAIYSYRFPLGNGFLGLGAQASIRNFSQDFGDTDLVSTVQNDPDIPQGQLSKFVPDFGVGVYYNTDDFYFGASIPRLLNNEIDLTNFQNDPIGEEVSHVFIMAGYKIDLTDNLELLPQALVKYAENSPLDIDFNLSLLIQDKWTVGGTYRFGGDDESFGESIDLLLGAQFTSHVFAGLSWDFTLSEIKREADGSLEIVLRYCFESSEGEEFANPRFF